MDGPGASAVFGAPPVERVAARGRRRFTLPRAGLRAVAAALLAAGVGGSAYLTSRRSPAVSRGAEDAASTLAAAAPASAAGGQPALSPAPAVAPPRMVAEAARRSAARKPSPATPAPAAGIVQSERRARRAGPVPADSGACFAVARVPSEARLARAAGSAPVPSPFRLGAADAVRAGGRVRGRWALVGTDSLRVTWYDPALPALAFGRDGAGWVGGGLRLTPATEERCGPP